MTKGDFDMADFDRAMDTRLDEYDAETSFITEQPVPEESLRTAEQLETQLNKLREGTPTHDVALRELTETRVKIFYKSKGFDVPQRPASEFEIRKDFLLWHKATNIRLESKPNKPYAESTLKQRNSHAFTELGLIQTRKPLTETAVKKLESIKEITNDPLTGDHDISAIADEVNSEVVSIGSNESLPMREIYGLNAALQRIRGELVNNLAKLSELDKDIIHEKEKLKQASQKGIDNETREMIRERIRLLEDERKVRIEAASASQEAFRTQMNRIRETVERILNADTTLAAKLRTLFREQGITIASILTALSFIISTIVLAVSPKVGGVSPPGPSPTPKDGDVKIWIKKQLNALSDLLKELAAKASAALPGIIGAIVSWLLKVAETATVWLAEHLWALVVGIVVIVLSFVKEKYQTKK